MKKPFLYGWAMVLLAAIVPVIFSISVGLSVDAATLVSIKSRAAYNSLIDMSYIMSYVTFGTLHILICAAATYYTYDVVKNTSSIHVFGIFRKNHISAFFLVAFIFIAATCFDSPLRRLSCDLLWIGLGRLPSTEAMFRVVAVIPLCNIEIRLFNLIPISLVIAAFAPASAIMMTTPHLAEKVIINKDTTPDDIASSFLNDFETVYLLMVSLLISSAIATNLYLRTPYSAILEKESVEFSRLINSTFAMWCFVYFIILISVLLVSYALVSARICRYMSRVDIIMDGKNAHGIRHTVNVHFFIRKNSSLFASSFSPIILLLIKNVIS